MRSAALLSALLLLPTLASALTINELAYDLPGSDTDREWLELWQETGCVNLSGWKFFEAGTNHRLTLVQGSERLCDGAFAVIAEDSAGFLADHPGFTGTLFDSSFSLSNTGETLAMKDPDGVVVDTVTYSSSWGAAGNGRSLERNSSGWYESLVNGTPGAANSILTPPPGQQNEGQRQSEQSSGSQTSEQSGQQAQPDQQTPSNQTTGVTPSAPAAGSLLISLVGPPAEVEAGSSFMLKVRLFNNFSITKRLDVSSYAFSGQNLATEGGWKPNAFTFVLGPGEVRTIDLLNEIKPDVAGSFRLRARAFDGSSTWDTEAPLVVVEPDVEAGLIAQPADNAGSVGPTGAFMVGNVDLVQALASLLGGLRDWLSGMLSLV